MADEKISQLADGTSLQAADLLVVARSGDNYKLTGTELGAGFQPVDADLTAIAALDSSTAGAIASDGSGWIKKTYAQFKTALGLVKTDVGLGSVDNTADSAKVVASAAILTTARTINGVSFDGSANITNIAEATHAATSKATPVDADELALVDSAASNVLKKLTWTNVKATLKTYFDTLYQATIGTNGLAVAKLVAGTAGQVLGGTGPGYSYPPGYELGYTEITASVNVASTTESSGTTIISPGAITFDGAAVLCHFQATIKTPAALSTTDLVIISLFESTTQIGRIATAQIGDLGTTGQAITVSVSGFYRFTPSAGSHTYTVTAHCNSTTGTPTVGAGGAGTGGLVPAFVRFTKV